MKIDFEDNATLKSHSRPIVSREFREQLLLLAPGLSINPHYWKFASYLLFPRSVDGRRRRILVPQATIYDCLGGKGNIAAIRQVEKFSADVWPIKLSPWTFGWATKENECRYVEAMLLPEGIKQLVARELKNPAVEQMVYLDDGGSFSTRSQKLERDYLCESTATDQLPGLSIQEDEILNYLNGLPPNRFSKILVHTGEAIEKARKHRDHENQLALLRLIQTQPKPYYKSSPRSTRIYSENASLLRLASPIRKTLTQDWIQADLASCQLAVCSAKWGEGIPEIRTYLLKKLDSSHSESLWEDLSSHLGMTYCEERKVILKEALYSIIFGQSQPKSEEYFTQNFPDGSQVWEVFKTHPIIAALLRARTKEFKKLKSNGFGLDAFGKKIIPTLGSNNKPNWPSVMAICAQSYEMALLYPLVPLAKINRGKSGFEILMWLHDGIAFVCDRTSSIELWKYKIKDVVDKKAEELGIPTWLEIG